MASGQVNRANRPNTWPLRPTPQSEDSPCQPGAVHTWPISEVAAHLVEVRLSRRGRLDLLRLSSSHFDPTRTSETLVLTRSSCDILANLKVFWMGVVFFRAAFRDGTCRRLRSTRMAGMPSAGITLSIKPTVLLCRSHEHWPCARTREFI
jgi:hypothetical protein